jgi:hypothetical protein
MAANNAERKNGVLEGAKSTVRFQRDGLSNLQELPLITLRQFDSCPTKIARSLLYEIHVEKQGEHVETTASHSCHRKNTCIVCYCPAQG